MMEFKDGRHERAFQTSYAEEHRTWDLSVCMLGWMTWFPVIINMRNHFDVRSISWHVVFLALFTSEKVRKRLADIMIPISIFMRNALVAIHEAFTTFVLSILCVGHPIGLHFVP